MATILVVEDDRHQRLLLSDELEYEGYAVCLAADAKDALVWMALRAIDLVVIDIHLPGMNGIELLAKLLDLDRRLPVVIHTADATYRDNYLSWPADGYVLKQSDLSELTHTIRVLLRDRAATGVACSPAPAPA